MRILLDYRPALRARTGVGEYVHGLALALSRADPCQDELTLFSSSWKDRVAMDVAAAMPGVTIADLRVPVRLLNLAWHRLGWPSIESLTGASHDVVHSLHPLSLPSRSAAQVVTIHDLDFLTHPERTSAEVRRDYPALAAMHARRADRVIVPSRYTAAHVEQLLHVAGDRITVCPPGAPEWPAAPARRSAPEEPYLLFVGTLEPRKNVGVLLEAYAQLVIRRPDAPRLVLAGKSTEHAARWLSAIEIPPLAGKVEYRGYVADSDRRRLYEEASLFICPSLDEGFGLPVLEAMSLGIPVVASARGAIPEVLGDAGVLVEPDADAIRGAIERMIADPALAARYAAKGRGRSRQFSWTASAEILRSAYVMAVTARRDRLH